MGEELFIELTNELQQIITAEQAWHFSIVPKSNNEKQWEFYADEEKISAALQNELETLLGKNIVLEKTPYPVIFRTLGKYYRKKSGEIKKQSQLNVKKTDDFLPALI